MAPRRLGPGRAGGRRPPKPLWKTIRKPLPRQTGGPHGGKKGARGYERGKARTETAHEVDEGTAPGPGSPPGPGAERPERR